MINRSFSRSGSSLVFNAGLFRAGAALCAAALLSVQASNASEGSDIEYRPVLPVPGLCDLREAYETGLDGAVLSRPTSQALPGQAFLARNGPCPWLFVRTRFDEAPMKVSMYECGTPRYWKNSVDCGRFGAGGGGGQGFWQIEDCTRTFADIAYPNGAVLTISRIIPAFLMETDESEVFLLRPTNHRYEPGIDAKWQQWRKSDWRLTGRPNIPAPLELVPEFIPVNIAMATGGGVKIFSAMPGDELQDLPARAPELDEPWLLVWNGGRKPIEVPPPSCGNYPSYAADMPWLFVLQRRPSAITVDPEGGVILEFKDKAGAIAGLPLFGNRLPAAIETEKWAKGLPENIVELCRRWTKYTRYFPLTVIESAKLAANGDVVIGEEFEYREIKDEWGTGGVKAGFLPPMLTVAAGTTESVQWSSQPVGMDSATFNGDVQLIEGERYEITLKVGGIFDKTRKPRADAPLAEAAKPALAKLEQEIDWVLGHGHLAPYFPFVQKLWAQEWLHVYPCWARPEAMIRALMYAYPHLDAERQAKVRDYLRAEFEQFPPAITGSMPPDKGVRRESFPCEPHLWAAPEYVDLIAPHKKQLASVIPPTWYALWQYASETGDWDYIRANWGDIREQIIDLASYGQWDTLGLLNPPNFTLSGGNGDVNGAFAGFLGAARLARGADDKEIEELALITASKMFVCRLAFENYYDFIWERLTAESLRDGTHPDKTVVKAAAKSGAKFRVRELDDFGPVVWPYPAPFNQTGLDATFMHACPELAKGMMAFVPDAVKNYEDYVRREYALWHCSKIFPFPVRWEENPFAAPQIGWVALQLYAWAFDWDGPALKERMDIPWCRGDWFYIEKLAHTLTAFKGWERE